LQRIVENDAGEGDAADDAATGETA
jgi:hypothetical protein